ncbi:hypothetical protein FCOIX_2458 [Fusarium coicis]|nr:hypothetical protein FCOIX_2458 [Fusarium coicis]
MNRSIDPRHKSADTAAYHDLIRKLDRIFAEEGNSRVIEHIRSLAVTDKHPFQTPNSLLPTEDAKERRDFALAIQDYIRTDESQKNFQLKGEQMAAIMSIPREQLLPGGSLSPAGLPLTEVLNFKDRLESIWPFSLHCKPLTKKKTRTKLPVPPRPADRLYQALRINAKKKIQRPNIPKRGSTGKKRRKKGAKNAIAICVFMMKTANPDVCHILPFTFNDTLDNAKKTENFYHGVASIMGKEFFERLRGQLADMNNLGTTDRAWNMICLNPQLHRWWSKAYFGLQCLGIEHDEHSMATLTIQFRWMPQIRKRIYERVQVSGRRNHWSHVKEDDRQFSSERRPSAQPPRSRTGHIIRLSFTSEDGARCKEMLDLQWACIKMTALAGGAGDPELFSDQDPEGKATEEENEAGSSKPPKPLDRPLEHRQRHPNVPRDQGLSPRPAPPPSRDASPEKSKIQTEQATEATTTETLRQTRTEQRQDENVDPWKR